MKSEELVNNLKKVREETYKLERQLEIKKAEEKKLNSKLSLGITFRPNEMLRILSYLMAFKTGNVYVPKVQYYAMNGCRYIGCLIDDNDSEIKIYAIDAACEWLERYYLLSYKFLKDKYLVDIDEYEDIYFDNYPDIKEFIYYLAECQIAKEKHLTYDEMIKCLGDFTKNKPKTKELNKNN